MAEAKGTLVAVIDRDVCAGHGRCYGLAPDLFAPDERGYGVEEGEPDRARDLATLEPIAFACPEGAISIVNVEDRGSQDV